MARSLDDKVLGLLVRLSAVTVYLDAFSSLNRLRVVLLQDVRARARGLRDLPRIYRPSWVSAGRPRSCCREEEICGCRGWLARSERRERETYVNHRGQSESALPDSGKRGMQCMIPMGRLSRTVWYIQITARQGIHRLVIQQSIDDLVYLGRLS